MSLENQTVGFITSCLKDICDCVRQKRIGNYRADLCINECIVVECDEFGHNDRDPNAELQREIFIESEGYQMVRFNPNEPGFDLSKVINIILGLIARETEVDKKRRHKERMLELSVQRDVQLKQLDIELKKLEVQSHHIQLQSQQLQLQSQSLQARPSQRPRPSQSPSQSSQESRPSQPQALRKSGPIRVSQYTLDGQFIKTFNSFVEAAQAVNGDRSSLSEKCSFGVAYKNYIWKRAE